MDYKKKLALAKEALDSGSYDKETIEYIFPELAESEDERIRKAIIETIEDCSAILSSDNQKRMIAWLEKQGQVKTMWNNAKEIPAPSENDILGWYKQANGMLEKNPKIIWFCSDDEAIKEAEQDENDFHLAYWSDLPNEKFDKKYWFEKQGEQKPQGKTALEAINEEKVDNANKVEPKFNEGDWVVWQDKCYKVNYNGCGYELIDQNGLSTSLEYGTVDENAHLWTIQDAKPGDVLAYITDKEDLWIMLYRSLHESYDGRVYYHALLINDNFYDKGTCCICIDNLKPATKEQRDTLIKAMTDAGHTFDFEKKELKKIEQKPLSVDVESMVETYKKRLTQQGNYFEGNILVDTYLAAFRHGIENTLDELNLKGFEKQEEHKPKWSEDDDGMVACIKSHLRQSLNHEVYIEWLKSIKQRIGGEE